MSEKYIPLYRKYRPKNLQEVVGQEHVKKALTNAINLKKISHAYLFTGPRGTGKTSIARILAKSLNCQEGPTLTPCEVCPSCVDIKNSTPMDVIEIDAASNRSVEDARNILEKIQYIPVNGKYKIYIIDEVHMLTNQAFNALLKTLEEPPENVIFILATTEPQKVLETITSRCQRFDFRRITTDDIVAHLKNISKLEKIKIEDDALFTIAKNAAGGMRDSLALLDQISVLDSSKKITTEDINKLLGRLSFDMLNDLSENIVQSKPQEAIQLLEKIYNSGNEPTQILVNMMGYLKNLLVVKNCSGKELLLDLTQLNDSQIEILKKQSENIETQQITFLIEKIAYYIKELKTTTNQHLWLEIAIIDLTNLAQNTSLLALQDRISNLESMIAGGNIQAPSPRAYMAPQAPVSIQKQSIRSEKVASEITNEVVKNTVDAKESSALKPKKSENFEIAAKQETAQKQEIPTVGDDRDDEEMSPVPISHKAPSDSNDIGGLWLALLQNISSTPTVSLLSQHARPVEISEQKVIIGCKENFSKMLSLDSKKKSIEEGVRKLFNKDVNIHIKILDASEFSAIEKKNLVVEKNVPKPVAKAVAPPVAEDVSDEEDFVEHELAKKAAKKNDKMATSDQVSMVMKLFDGKYID